MKTVNPCTNASGIQISGFSKWMSAQVAPARMANCRSGDDAVPPAGLAVELAHNVAGQGFAKLSSERNRVLRVVM